MSKPRWIDTGAFRLLRNATRKRELIVVVGPKHGHAEIKTRAQLAEALGDGDRAAVADDARVKAPANPALTTLYTLKQPGIATTLVSDDVLSSAPDDVESVRWFGPDSKGIKSAYQRKDPFVAHLCGSASHPESLVLGARERKVLAAPGSRYQELLRKTFTQTVVFTGFDLDDPDLVELLEDVSRTYNGHVPENLALVPAGTAEPTLALRATMHFGMKIVEHPSGMSADEALDSLAKLLEELEVPKPATGDPPRGFTELSDAMRAAVGEPSDEVLSLFDRGDASHWSVIRGAADAPRAAAGTIEDFVSGQAPEGKVRVALVRGAAGQGKTTLMRRLAWDLAEKAQGTSRRIFWREFGSPLPDRYVPAEREDAEAVFVCDDADELANLPQLLRDLAKSGAGKARFVLAADAAEWERSGLDHRIRQMSDIREVKLDVPEADVAKALAEKLAARGRLAEGLDVDGAAKQLVEGDRCLMDRLAGVRGKGSVEEAVAGRIAALADHADRELLERAYLGVAMVHRYGMSLSKRHLAALLGISEDEVGSKVLEPMGDGLVPAGEASLRTPHPLYAEAVCKTLADEEAKRDAIVVDLLSTLPAEASEDKTTFHAPSELIRAVRKGPIPPFTLDAFFKAGEERSSNDPLFWLDRGRVDVGFSRWESALGHFDQALRARPAEEDEKQHNALVHSYRARCLQGMGKKREALAACEEGLRLAPRDDALQRLREKLGGRRVPRAGAGGAAGAGRGGRRGGPGGGGRGRGGPRGGGGGGRGQGGGGRGGPGGGGGRGAGGGGGPR